METVIISAIMNILAWSNVEFIQQKKTNERLYDCEWVDVGWQKPTTKVHHFIYSVT